MRFAEAVGIERSMVAKTEAGRRRVTAVELLAMSDALDVPMTWLLRRPEQRLVSRREAHPGDSGHSASDFDLSLALEEWAQDVLQMRQLGVLTLADLPRFSATSADDARRQARTLREHLGFGSDPVGGMADVAARCGLWVWSADVVDGGASLALGPSLGAAVVSGRADPGRRRFTAAHELGHHVLADAYEVGAGVAVSRQEREGLIDAFAAEFLVPAAVVESTLVSRSRASLVELAGRFRVSWSVILSTASRLTGQAQRQPTPTRAELLEVLGSLPEHDLTVGTTSATWQRLVVEAHAESLITKARAAELLRGDWRMEDL